MPNGSLVINDVSTEDTGRYTCIAGNSCNIAHTSAELYVVGESDTLHVLQLLVRSHQICWILYFLDGCPFQLQKMVLQFGSWYQTFLFFYFKPSGTTNCFNLHVHLNHFISMICSATFFQCHQALIFNSFWLYSSPIFHHPIPYGLNTFFKLLNSVSL